MSEPVRESVLVDGCRISYLVSGKGPTLVLIHGGSAHGGWWTRVSTLLAPKFRVVVPDLSGHGQSGHRKVYSASLWAGEIAHALQSSGATRGFVIGHSMGGAVGVCLAASRYDVVDGLVLVDTDLLPSVEDPPNVTSPRPITVYATREEILDRFRLLPAGAHSDQRDLRELAEESIVSTADGWTWRYDPEARQRIDKVDLGQQLPLIRCPVGYIAGEFSPISGQASVRQLEQQLGRKIPYAVIPNAAHHVPLDSPELCAAAVEDFVSQWLAAESDSQTAHRLNET